MTGEELKNRGERCGIAAAVESLGGTVEIELPLTAEFLELPISELNLNVRAYNGLMRSNLQTILKLADAIMCEKGIECIRNLGKKSVYEIKCALLTEGYNRLSPEMKTEFCHKVAERSCT